MNQKSSTKVAQMSTSLVSVVLFFLALTMLSHTLSNTNNLANSNSSVVWTKK